MTPVESPGLSGGWAWDVGFLNLLLKDREAGAGPRPLLVSVAFADSPRREHRHILLCPDLVVPRLMLEVNGEVRPLSVKRIRDPLLGHEELD
jgi:hypothetical protein